MFKKKYSLISFNCENNIIYTTLEKININNRNSMFLTDIDYFSKENNCPNLYNDFILVLWII